MKRFALVKIVGCLALGAGLSACTTVVTKDYSNYLANNENTATFKKVDVGQSYYLTPQTEKHSKKISSGMAGYANSWIVEFKDIAQETVKSKDFKEAFGNLSKVNEGDLNKGKVMVVDLQKYDFTDTRAQIDLNLSVVDQGKTVFKKSYSAQGPSQGGKMFWGGAMAMKNAVQQSTKNAMDEILKKFSDDIAKK